MLKRLGLVLLLLTYIFIPACAGGGGQLAGGEPAAATKDAPVEAPVLSINSGKLDPEFGENNSGYVTTDR